jgi:hypothetical protein
MLRYSVDEENVGGKEIEAIFIFQVKRSLFNVSLRENYF